MLVSIVWPVDKCSVACGHGWGCGFGLKQRVDVAFVGRCYNVGAATNATL